MHDKQCIDVGHKQLFMCDDWRYVDCSLRCDGVIDCENALDERYCPIIPLDAIVMQHLGNREEKRSSMTFMLFCLLGLLMLLIAFILTVTKVCRKRKKEGKKKTKDVNRLPRRELPPPYTLSSEQIPSSILPPPYKERDDAQDLQNITSGLVNTPSVTSPHLQAPSVTSIHVATTSVVSPQSQGIDTNQLEYCDGRAQMSNEEEYKASVLQNEDVNEKTNEEEDNFAVTEGLKSQCDSDKIETHEYLKAENNEIQYAAIAELDDILDNACISKSEKSFSR